MKIKSNKKVEVKFSKQEILKALTEFLENTEDFYFDEKTTKVFYFWRWHKGASTRLVATLSFNQTEEE